MSMYIRVKRQKTTVFVHVEPSETILEVKNKLQDLVDQSPEHMQLLRLDGTVLEDAKKLAELRVENDEVLALAFWQNDAFEPICIDEYLSDQLAPGTPTGQE